MSKPTAEAARRWDGQALWQAADLFRQAAWHSLNAYPDIWDSASGKGRQIADDITKALAGVTLVVARLGYHPGQTAPDSAPALTPPGP